MQRWIVEIYNSTKEYDMDEVIDIMQKAGEVKRLFGCIPVIPAFMEQ